MRRLSAFLLILLASSVAYGRGATPKELVIDLKFKPQEGVHSDSPALPPAMLEKSVDLRVEDGRKEADPRVIGQGTGGNDKTFPIRAGNDIAPFVKEVIDSVGKSWSLNTATPSDRILNISVTRFFLDESNKALGSMYSSDVKLAFTLKDAKGKVLAEGVGSGSTHRYGRAHSVENSNEVLSDALKEAFANVLDDSSMQTAWSSGKGSAKGGSSQSSTPSKSVEERLKDLDALYKKGLIKKEEYDRKRAEILKDI